ncbi:MaoC/PaaZ C-terminal domain-containing protein [Burkholderia sp. Ac-20353]|uniref:MaoC/PaaZ C-terminal domain-containing protein n=1 Tax=Burkholderia sp. Ac-20353 TaxID=2703894 RepID=UPI001F11AD47|nr:MaoC/PaaZ C-terminal domain-containing protein [Burkholderia sp. Ac-20353]
MTRERRSELAIDHAALANWTFADVPHRYTKRDTILYALGVGAGTVPHDTDDLPYVYEEALSALPTMAVVLGYPGFWIRRPETGIDWRAVLHVEQKLVVHRPIRAEGTVVGRTRVVGLYDRGPDRGAVLTTSRDIIDADTGTPIASVTSTELCRSDGGWGGPAFPRVEREPMPTEDAHRKIPLRVAPNTALIYRLSGDDNPLHVDPAVAATMGYERPILHGLCSFGMAGHALVRAIAGNDPGSVREMRVRFTAPVYPGDDLMLDLWQSQPAAVRFRVRAPLRNAVVIDDGYFRIDAGMGS